MEKERESGTMSSGLSAASVRGYRFCGRNREKTGNENQHFKDIT